MNSPKKESDILGVKIACPSFSKCPICYGCRNYSSHMIECTECGKNTKLNVCNTSLHVTETISSMITKTKLEL